jgi:hypothetical protein
VTPSEVISEARSIISDTRVTYRYSDVVMLGFVNQTLKRIVSFRPDIFSYIGTISTTANTVLQSLPADAVRLVEIFQVTDGNAVTEVNRETLDQMYPEWVSETAGTPVNFMRHPRNPNKYFLYPRPASGVTLVGEYIQAPPTYTLNQTITLVPDSFFPIIVDGTVFLAESVDNEHVNNGRAKLFYETFLAGINASLGTRIIPDAENAAVQQPG